MKLRNQKIEKSESKSPQPVKKKISKQSKSKDKKKGAKSNANLKRTKTIVSSIKESEVYLERQEKIEKDQKKKEKKSVKGSKSPIPSKKIKKSVEKKKSVSKSKTPEKEKKKDSKSKKIKMSIEKKKSVSKSKTPEKKKNVNKIEKVIKKSSEKKEKEKKVKEDKKEKKIKEKKVKEDKKSKKEDKKPKKEDKKPKKEDKKEDKAAHPPVIVRQPSKLPDEAKSTALKRQESKVGQPGFPTAGIIDAVFCMDTTGSMGSYLAQAKKVIDSIMKKIDDKVKGTKIDVKFGFVAYRDHPPQDKTYVTKFQQLDTQSEVKKFITGLNTIPGGGGDFPEAVMDGLMDSAKLTSWRDSTEVPQLRYIFHICDAPPHGQKEFGSSSSQWNDGCPCGITTNDIAHQINLNQIHYRLIKIGASLEKMSQVFKEKFTNFDEQPIDSAENLDIHVTDMIMRELLPDF